MRLFLALTIVITVETGVVLWFLFQVLDRLSRIRGRLHEIRMTVERLEGEREREGV